MKRTLAIVTAVTAFATFPLYAEDDYAAEDYGMRQDGAWPTSWPRELDPLRRHYAPSGRFTATFWRSGEDSVHYGIRFTTREECEAAWPHLLKVKSKGAPIILRRGPSFWLGGASHGVCVHQQPAIWRVNGRNVRINSGVGTKPLSEQELKKLKTTNYIELFVDGKIVDLNRISLPSETPIIDERFKDTDSKDTDSGVKPHPEETPATEVKDSAGEEKIVWGKESNGLVANLRALKTAVKPGEPIEFEIRVKNVSKEEIFLLGYKKPSPHIWSFNFGQWEWSPPGLSLPSVPLKPGDTASVRCLVATTRDSLTAEQKGRLDGSRRGDVSVAPFRNVKNKKESVRLPEGFYRVRAATRGFSGRERNKSVETNTIEVRIIDRR